MADYAAILAVHYKNTEWGIGNGTYQELADSWVDAQTPLPAQATLDALSAGVDAYISVIDDMPTKDELDGVMLGVITGAAATTILDRRVAALAAKTKIP